MLHIMQDFWLGKEQRRGMLYILQDFPQLDWPDQPIVAIYA